MLIPVWLWKYYFKSLWIFLQSDIFRTFVVSVFVFARGRSLKLEKLDQAVAKFSGCLLFRIFSFSYLKRNKAKSQRKQRAELKISSNDFYSLFFACFSSTFLSHFSPLVISSERGELTTTTTINWSLFCGKFHLLSLFFRCFIQPFLWWFYLHLDPLHVGIIETYKIWGKFLTSHHIHIIIEIEGKVFITNICFIYNFSCCRAFETLKKFYVHINVL